MRTRRNRQERTSVPETDDRRETGREDGDEADRHVIRVSARPPQTMDEIRDRSRLLWRRLGLRIPPWLD